MTQTTQTGTALSQFLDHPTYVGMIELCARIEEQRIEDCVGRDANGQDGINFYADNERDSLLRVFFGADFPAEDDDGVVAAIYARIANGRSK